MDYFIIAVVLLLTAGIILGKYGHRLSQGGFLAAGGFSGIGGQLFAKYHFDQSNLLLSFGMAFVDCVFCLFTGIVIAKLLKS